MKKEAKARGAETQEKTEKTTHLFPTSSQALEVDEVDEVDEEEGDASAASLGGALPSSLLSSRPIGRGRTGRKKAQNKVHLSAGQWRARERPHASPARRAGVGGSVCIVGALGEGEEGGSGAVRAVTAQKKRTKKSEKLAPQLT